MDHRGRGTDGLADRLTGQCHQAAHRLTQRVEGGTIDVRAVLPEAGDRDQDDAGIQGSEPVVVKAHRLHDAGAEVFEDDVRFLDELAEQLFPFAVAQVDAHALLAAIVDTEVHALTADERRMLAGLLTIQALDLDHPGPEVAEQHPPPPARPKDRPPPAPPALARAPHPPLPHPPPPFSPRPPAPYLPPPP